jgi:DUF1680 family protein
MWAHQHDQQANQVECSIRAERKARWTTNGPDANIFGLEPNDGCCTANLSQGWPKLAAHLWMRTERELAAVAYAPGRASAEFGGVPVAVSLETDYPFRDVLEFTVAAAGPVQLALLLRIPAWAEGAELLVGGKRAAAPPVPGTLARVEREWRGRTRLTLRLPMRPRVVRRPRGAVAIERGPLVYALRIAEFPVAAET